MSCFEGKTGRKPLITCKTVCYTYIMIYMVKNLFLPRKFWHQGCGRWIIFLSAIICSTLRVMVVTQILESLLVHMKCRHLSGDIPGDPGVVPGGDAAPQVVEVDLALLGGPHLVALRQVGRLVQHRPGQEALFGGVVRVAVGRRRVGGSRGRCALRQAGGGRSGGGREETGVIGDKWDKWVAVWHAMAFEDLVI